MSRREISLHSYSTMARSSRSKPAEELVELPEDEFESEEDADYSGGEEPASESGSEEEEDADEEAGQAGVPEDDDDQSTADDVPPQGLDPYQVLGVGRDATASQIKKMYHKAALKHHPDKVPVEQRVEADAKFKEIAFAYSILGDEKKKQQFDSTGRTDGDGSEFNWSDFMANQYKVAINEDVLANVRKEYVGTAEEQDDVLKAYKKGKGSWTTIFAEVMLSVMLNVEDEKRFRGYIDDAISKGEVKTYSAYKESEADRSKRLKKAEREAKEADKILKKMGIKQDPAKMTEDELAVLIKSRRPETFSKLDDESTEALARHFEEKYGTPKKKNRKRKSELGTEPSEEEFLAAQERIKQRKK